MPINVLLVDDSNFFQHRLQEILAQCPDLRVVGVAGNGREAISMARQLRPDVITMDYEMPIMDGVSAVRQIMSERPTPILMFSSLTYEGARITLDALDAGAVDFLPKNFAEVSGNSMALKEKLHQRIVALSRSRKSGAVAPRRVAVAGAVGAATAVVGTGVAPVAAAAPLKGKIELLLLGASTGGPVALTEILTCLPADFPLPVVVVQHMPENFTRAFAERLDQQSPMRVREAAEGDCLLAGTALVAPGGKQLMIDSRGRVRILPADDRVIYKPSLDITFGSAANAFGARVLAVVLTGMGADGCEGARLIKQQGGAVWSQNEFSSVVYGMPMAVARARLSDRVLGLEEIGPTLVEEL